MLKSREITTVRSAIALIATALVAFPAFAGVTAIKAKRILTGAGEAIDNGVIVITDGKITAIGPGLAVPSGAKTIDCGDKTITPGLVDACCVLNFDVQQSWGWRGGAAAEEAPKLASRVVGPEGALIDTGAEAPPHRDLEGDDSYYIEPDPRPAATDTTLCGPWSRIAAIAAEHARHTLLGEPCVCGSSQLAPEGESSFAPSVGPYFIWGDNEAEVIPHRRVLDSVNLMSLDFQRLLSEGVTTVFVSPDSASVIAARGAIVKTGGALGDRVVRAEDAVKASMGADPSRRGWSNQLPYGGRATMYTRRPTTRMGVEWVFRKAFFDARRYAAGLALTGADVAPTEAFDVLNSVLAGETPLRIQVRKQHDMFTALRLAKEFGIKPLLEEGTEAYQTIPLLKESHTPIVFGPLYMESDGYRAFSGETDEARLSTPKLLQDAGVEWALTAQEGRGEESLPRQAMIAIRYGLEPAQALTAVTSSPAKLMNLEGRVGALKVGADADLVVWSGEPFAATSRPEKVLINGQVAYER
ncbi:MAG: amidohydrolase family protein [Phycisphaerales bacterium]|nr:amidohydrolase family protein [Phycisphaerales bacterium]